MNNLSSTLSTEAIASKTGAKPKKSAHSFLGEHSNLINFEDISRPRPRSLTTGGNKETLKFKREYDFGKASEEFKEVLEKLQVSGDLIPNVDFWFWRKDLFKNAACMPSNEIQNETL